MNCALYGFGPARTPQMVDGRSRRRLRRATICRASISSCRISLSSRRRRKISSASSSPTPMRTISAPLPISGRGSACRSTLRGSPPACCETRRLAEPGAPKIPIQSSRKARSVRHRPVQCRIYPRRPFDSREAAPWRSARPPGSIVHTGDWKIDGRRRRRTDRRGASDGIGRGGRARADLHFDQCAARGRKPVRKPMSPRFLPTDVGEAKGRVVVTTFASNVARLRAAAEAGCANGRRC